jgi:MFS family permease
VSTHAAAGLLAAINVLAIAARIGSGRISDRLGSRLVPLRAIGVVLAVSTAGVAPPPRAPLGVLVPALPRRRSAQHVLERPRHTPPPRRTAGAAHTGAALGFQQTLLGVVVAGAPPVVAIVATHSWRLAFILAAVGPRARRRDPAAAAGAV